MGGSAVSLGAAKLSAPLSVRTSARRALVLNVQIVAIFAMSTQKDYSKISMNFTLFIFTIILKTILYIKID